MEIEELKRIGAGMYMVHGSAERDLHGTFQELHLLGYQGIEFYGEPVYDVDMVRKALEDAELALTGWHIEWRHLQENSIEKTVDYLKRVGCGTAVIPCLGGKWNVGHGAAEECREIWLLYIARINEINRKLKKEGIRLGYHNHEHEFMLQYDGVKVFDLLFDGLDEDVIMELDSGNCIEGGDDPLRILEKYKGRDMILHLKPFGTANGFDTVLGAEDDLNDWKRILDPERKRYVWMLIESENTALPELVNAKLCIRGLNHVLRGEVQG